MGDTHNPLYTDTRYNDKIRYDNNMTDTKPSLQRQLVTKYARIVYLTLKETYVLDIASVRWF